MARWLIPSNDETDDSDRRIQAREDEAMQASVDERRTTISREQLLERMVKNHGLTREEAEKRLDEGLQSCNLAQDGDKIELPQIFKFKKPDLN